MSADNFPRKDVSNKATLAYTILNEPFKFRTADMEAKPEDFEFGKKVWGLAEKLMGEGKFKSPPVATKEGGLNGILGGLQDLKSGKVSGTKLVYTVG